MPEAILITTLHAHTAVWLWRIRDGNGLWAGRLTISDTVRRKEMALNFGSLVSYLHRLVVMYNETGLIDPLMTQVWHSEQPIGRPLTDCKEAKRRQANCATQCR